VTVVKPATNRCPASILGYALLAAQDEVAALAEGSTGQTELSPGRLASFKVVVPSAGPIDRIAGTLEYCDELGTGLQRETALLTELRDTILPKLVAGKQRVRDVEALVEDVL
jgi:type I restriction enzyme S subunit